MQVFELALLVLLALGASAYGFLIRPGEKELGEVIPDIWSAYIRQLKAVLAQDITMLGDITPKERKYGERKRLELIVEWLPKLTHNVELFQALGRSLTRRASKQPVDKWNTQDFKAAEMLRRATLCRLMLAYAQLHFAILLAVNTVGWPLTWPVVARSLRLCGVVVEQYRGVERLALKVSAAHGSHHYENLLAAL
jgi:hypothetical protein